MMEGRTLLAARIALFFNARPIERTGMIVLITKRSKIFSDSQIMDAASKLRVG